MPLSDIEEQPRALALLRASLAGGRVQHAYLFAGPEGVGKESAARIFAQALTCPVRPDEGCGTCATCGRVERGNHPDVSFLMTEDAQVRRGLLGRSEVGRSPSRDIRVEQVRGLQDRLVRRPLEASRKVALVIGAESMNPSAQNAFLKTLEEPPAETVLVLVTSAPHLLLPTLQSRLSRVPFGPHTADWISARLVKEGWPEASARAAALLAEGSLGAARRMDAGALEERERVVQQFEALPRDDARPLLRFAEAHGGSREEAEVALRLLLGWNTEVARVREGADSPQGTLASLARTVAERTAPIGLERRHQVLSRTLEWIGERNGSPRLQLEGMLLELFA